MNHATDQRLRTFTAELGLMTVALFVMTFLLLGSLTPGFHLLTDYISRLGARGAPFETAWNLIGFGTVGVGLAVFGWCFGLVAHDRILGACLTVAGLGFALRAAPTDFADAEATLSKVHYASICLALAGFCGALARLTRGGANDPAARKEATMAVALVIFPIVACGAGLCTEPIAHRAILAVVLGWVWLNAFRIWPTEACRSG
ncbi:MAG: DUF998 domain-containing protein [Planctomycetota bacterium]